MINKSWYLRDQGALVRMKGNSGGTYGTTRHFPLRYVARLRPQPPPLPSEPAGNGPVGEPVRFVNSRISKLHPPTTHAYKRQIKTPSRGECIISNKCHLARLCYNYPPHHPQEKWAHERGTPHLRGNLQSSRWALYDPSSQLLFSRTPSATTESPKLFDSIDGILTKHSAFRDEALQSKSCLPVVFYTLPAPQSIAPRDTNFRAQV